MNLEDNFVKYRDITLTIIEIVKLEEYEKMDEFFQQRQSILNDINKINYSKEELKKFYLQYNIAKLEKTLTLEMNLKKENLLNKIKENNKRQSAMKGYNNLATKAIFLSKEF